MTDTKWICGGQITPEAAVELEEFAHHLKAHPRGGIVDRCRFCIARERPSYRGPRANAPEDIR